MSLHKRSLALVVIVVTLGACCVVSSGCSQGSAKVKNGSIVYAALGDSTGAGYGAGRSGGYVERLYARIKEKRPDSRLLNLSTSGASTEQALRRQVDKLVAADPSLVTISIGSIDLLQGVSEEQFAKNYEEIVSRVSETDAVIIATTLPDLSTAPALSKLDPKDLSSRLAGYNQQIEKIAGQHQLQLVDLYGMSREALQKHPEFFSSDGMHPSDAGYEYWAELLWPTVNEVLS